MNVNLSRLTATLSRDEGKDLKRHNVDGVDHIGIGRNLEGRGLTDEEMEVLGVSDEDDVQVITEEECQYLFENDLALSVSICGNIFSADVFQSLTQVRQEVLLNMAFNLGEPRMRRFAKMINAINEGDWEEAADEMLDSKAARTQAPDRYNRLARAMEFDDPTAFEVAYEDPEGDVITEISEGSNEEDIVVKEIMTKFDNVESRLEEMHATLNEMREINNTLLNMLSDSKQKPKKSFLSGVVL